MVGTASNGATSRREVHRDMDFEPVEPLETPSDGITDEAPPAYSEHHDQLELSQAGLSANAIVTNDGRVNINISQKNRLLTELLVSTLRHKQVPSTQPIGALPPPYIPPGLGGKPDQAPPPKLNVVIQVVGSRGDVQPFVALGKVLKSTYGHRVRLATHQEFQTLVEDGGLEFFCIGGNPAELMAYMVKNPGLIPGFNAMRTGEITKRREDIAQIMLGCWRSCIETGSGLGPAPPSDKRRAHIDDTYALPRDSVAKPFVADAIVANPPSFAHIHLAEKLGIPLHMMFTMPWSPTRAFPHPLVNIESTNTDEALTNYISYALVDMMTWQGLGNVINRFREKFLDLPALSLIWAPGLLSRLQIPTTYCWSPALIPKPSDWTENTNIAGFYFHDLASSYTPDLALVEFLSRGPPPIYIGFGSIVVDDPDALTRIVFSAVSTVGVRALVSKGWGGLGTNSVGIPDGVFMLGNCPHDWLFRHVSAVVHHGGAGTSAIGIKLGKPTVVVPFFGDQPFWGAMIAKTGAGPTPIPYKKLTTELLAAAIQEALKPETQVRAQELGSKIVEENGTHTGGERFHEFIDVDQMRCSLAPSRVAVWRMRKTHIRLSALAGAVLVQRNVLKYSDLSLYRPIEYNTEDQPWDPVTAVVSAFVGDVGNFALAIADFPSEVFRHRGKSVSGPNKRNGDAVATDSTSLLSEATMGSIDGTEASSSTTMPSPRLSVVANTSKPLSRDLPDERASAKSILPQANHRSLPVSELSPPLPIHALDTAISAGKGVGRIVGAGLKAPMNFAMGFHRGFRNAPKLYNDDTVRAQDKVTGLASGLKVGGKEFGLGIYDGVTGLVTQPYRGAAKDGAVGLLKGFGKGVGGFFLKNSAALCSIPAYMMLGVNAEVRKQLSWRSLNQIITSRILQGKEELEMSNVREHDEILRRFMSKRDEVGRNNFWKRKTYRPLQRRNTDTPDGDPENTSSPSTSQVRLDHHLQEESRQLYDHNRDLREGETELETTAETSLHTRRTATSQTARDERFRSIIQEPPQQVTQRSEGEYGSNRSTTQNSNSGASHMAPKGQNRFEHAAEVSQHTQTANRPGTTGKIETEEWSLTESEYKLLVDEAVQQSLAELQGDSGPTKYQELSGHHIGKDVEEKPLDAIEESKETRQRHNERAEMEDNVIREYVRRQRLSEEEYRISKGKGKGVSRR